MSTLETYAQAVDWIRPLWGDVLIPFRLHQREFDEGGGPEMTSAFRRLLEARATYTFVGPFMDRCWHLRAERSFTRGPSCPDCDDTGFVAKFGERYRYPMAAALHRLMSEPAMTAHQPTPAQVVVLLSRHAWDLAGTALSLGYAYEMMEALALLSLRKLERRYAVRPIARVGWVSKSEQQRQAEAM